MKVIHNNVGYKPINWGLPKIGSKIIETYRYNNVDYECPMNVVHIGQAETETKTYNKALWLEWEYTSCDARQFDEPEVLISIKQDLPIGTYYFKVTSDSWGGDTNKYIEFTTDTIIPAGYVLKPSNSYNVTMVGTNMQVFADLKTRTAFKNYVMSEGQNGQFLGSMWGTDTPDSMKPYLNEYQGKYLNHCHSVKLGYNNWSKSFLRQHLNSSGTGWWTAQHCFDRAPSNVDTIVGFLDGLSEDLKSVLKPVKVYANRNTTNDGGGVDITYDKIFLASKKQMAWAVDGAEDNVEEWEYYRKLADSIVGVGGYFQNYQTYTQMIKYGLNAKTSAQYVWKRSANRGNATSVWHVYTSGIFTSSSAYNNLRFLPACVICGENIKFFTKEIIKYEVK